MYRPGRGSHQAALRYQHAKRNATWAFHELDEVISRRRLFDRRKARSTVVVVGSAGYGQSVLLVSPGPLDLVGLVVGRQRPVPHAGGTGRCCAVSALQTPLSGRCRRAVARQAWPGRG